MRGRSAIGKAGDVRVHIPFIRVTGFKGVLSTTAPNLSISWFFKTAAVSLTRHLHNA